MVILQFNFVFPCVQGEPQMMTSLNKILLKIFSIMKILYKNFVEYSLIDVFERYY